MFRHKLRQEFDLSGDIAFYHVKNHLPTTKITNFAQTVGEALGHTKAVYVKYDETKTVAVGGYGTGAQGQSSTGHLVKSGGGIGYGGAIHARDGVRGGDGIGGDGRGDGFKGTGGEGFGGNATTVKANLRTRAGDSVGGDATDTY